MDESANLVRITGFSTVRGEMGGPLSMVTLSPHGDHSPHENMSCPPPLDFGTPSSLKFFFLLHALSGSVMLTYFRGKYA